MFSKRNGRPWTVNEILQLQREYELLEWNIQQIASKHQRTVDAILYKLEEEEFIDNWVDARGYVMPPEMAVEMEKQSIQRMVSDRLSTLRSRSKQSPTLASSSSSRKNVLHC
jgi:hypothetical protein